ncbi:MAG: hypothetical protein R3324_07995 [Halobacteriales archaeon]|nr:hypothetical protein [Halobacteriales archaeon]
MTGALWSIMLVALVASLGKDDGLQHVSKDPVESRLVQKPVTAISFQLRVDLTGNPGEVYDAITGDVSAWWDHHFSEEPRKFVLEARPGGRFIEIFDESGDGAVHATVIYAHRGERIRFAGPLGFSGRPVEIVTTYDFESLGPDQTRLEVSVNARGPLDEGDQRALRSVWRHFIFDRFEPYWEEKSAG